MSDKDAPLGDDCLAPIAHLISLLSRSEPPEVIVHSLICGAASVAVISGIDSGLLIQDLKRSLDIVSSEKRARSYLSQEAPRLSFAIGGANALAN